MLEKSNLVLEESSLVLGESSLAVDLELDKWRLVQNMLVLELVENSLIVVQGLHSLTQKKNILVEQRRMREENCTLGQNLKIVKVIKFRRILFLC